MLIGYARVSTDDQPLIRTDRLGEVDVDPVDLLLLGFGKVVPAIALGVCPRHRRVRRCELGTDIADSLVEEERLDAAVRCMAHAARRDVRMVLPTDAVVAYRLP